MSFLSWSTFNGKKYRTNTVSWTGWERNVGKGMAFSHVLWQEAIRVKSFRVRKLLRVSVEVEDTHQYHCFFRYQLSIWEEISKRNKIQFQHQYMVYRLDTKNIHIYMGGDVDFTKSLFEFTLYATNSPKHKSVTDT